MKKLLLCFFAISIMAGCNDDDNTPVDPVLSTLSINGSPFFAGSSADDVSTSFNNENHTRVFVISDGVNDAWTGRSIAFSIPVESALADASGVYGIDETNVVAYYWSGDMAFSLVSGTISITDFGDNHYRVGFDEVVTDSTNPNPNPNYTVDGWYEGSFKPI